MTPSTYRLWEMLSESELGMLLATGGIPPWAPFVVQRRARSIQKRVSNQTNALLGKELKHLRDFLKSERVNPQPG